MHMTAEWNGQPIKDMDTDHIINTISHLEKRAKTAYEHEGEIVRNTLDQFRAQAFDTKTWCDFLPESYYHLIAERDKRPTIAAGLNF